MTYLINGIELKVKTFKVSRGDSHSSPVWDLIFYNTKHKIKATFCNFFTYHSGYSQGTGRSVQGWYLTSSLFGSVGNGSGRETKPTPSKEGQFVDWAFEMLSNKDDYQWKSKADKIKGQFLLDDPENLLGFKEKDVNEEVDDTIYVLGYWNNPYREDKEYFWFTSHEGRKAAKKAADWKQEKGQPSRFTNWIKGTNRFFQSVEAFKKACEKAGFKPNLECL